MVLEEVKVTFLVKKAAREQVKYPGSPDLQGALPGPADCGGCAPGQGWWHRVKSLAVAHLPLEIVAVDQPAAELPEEAQHVALPPALLAVEPEQLQLSPVVQVLQHWVPDPTNKAVLDTL